MSDATTTTTELPDLDEYRAQARAWLEANLERRDPDAPMRLRGTEHRTHETIKPEKAIQRKLYDGGYAGITWPKEYGGQGLPSAYERVFNEEARGFRTPDLGVAGGTTFGICVPTMLQHASPEYLQHHIPKVLAGEELWVQFFSEPGAGSDLAGVTTKAEKDGDRWILNGSKIWSSGAFYADWGMCLARTNWDVPKHRGLTWFAVKIDQPGVEVLPVREINGDAEFCQEFFDNVELTDDDMIGELNQGWTVANTMLVFERGAGRGESGIPRPTGPRKLAPDLVALAQQVGREKDPYVRQLIAKAHINDYATGMLGARIGDHIRAASANAAGIASYGKLFSGTFQPVRARIGMEIGQGAALTWEDGDLAGMATSLNYLNGRVMSIAGGTNEVQRNGVGERVLGLPREPSFDTDRPFRDVVRDATNWTGKTN
ncbi:MAG TPA: acyl-CoA dehydrogenase family protein [Acidimicrobiia bacterium]|nr:acyl-CoA dehydrogenase family protein [Acidimicrobiia bacterium]